MEKVIPDNGIQDDELSLKVIILNIQSLWRYLLSKWKSILLAGIVCAGIGLAYAYLKKPTYIATLSFALEDPKSGNALGAYSGIASQLGLDPGNSGGGAFGGDNLIELMKSRTLTQKVLLTPVNIKGKTETLAELYIDFNGLRKKWDSDSQLKNIRFSPNSNPATFSLKQDSLISEFHKALLTSSVTVDRTDKKSNIIVVKVNSKNELFSKYFAEVLASEVSKFYIETKTKKASQNVNILQHQYDSVRHELNAAIYGVASSIDVNPNANPNRQILRTPAQHKQVDVQVNTSIIAEIVKNLEVAKVSLRNETPLIQVIDKPVLPLRPERFGKLKGIAIGFFVGLFLSAFFILIKRSYLRIMQ
jgi:uncharacterized protein involved in exopolysaccharide biosynthesis